MCEPGYAKCGCQHCGTHVEFPVELAETRIACPHCGGVTLLAGAVAPPHSAPLRVTPLAGWLSGDPIPGAPTSTRYRVALLLVAGMMLLMPLVYLGVVAVVGVGICYFATHAWAFFEGAGARRLRVLQRALRRSYEALRGSFQQRRSVPDNFPAFLLQQEALMPAALRARLERNLVEDEVEWFATHPTDLERIEQARRLNASGKFCGDGPATLLFGDFNVVARQVTLLHYTEDLGFPALGGLLAPVVTPATSR